MPIDADELKPASPWHPMKDPVQLKIFGKLIEELGELQAALARCIIQGLDEYEPVTNKPNKQWVADEIADVLCGIHLLQNGYLWEHEWKVYIETRKEKKRKHLIAWHMMA